MTFLMILFGTRQDILTIHPNFSRESAAKLTGKTGITDLPCLAGALRSSKQSLEELWGTDGDGFKKFRVAMNQRRFRFLFICILE